MFFFSFSPFLSFLCSLPRNVFLFFFSFLVFLSAFLFFSFSHLIFHHFFFTLFSYHFLLPFWSNIDRMGQRRKLPPHCLMPFVWPLFFLHFSLISYSLFMASYNMWLNKESHLQVNHMALPSVTLLGCHVASPNYIMCYLTPHALKNMKSRLPRNSMKFDVVARFREMIPTMKSISSSEIYKISKF